jgi:hypothetical protein
MAMDWTWPCTPRLKDFYEMIPVAWVLLRTVCLSPNHCGRDRSCEWGAQSHLRNGRRRLRIHHGGGRSHRVCALWMSWLPRVLVGAAQCVRIYFYLASLPSAHNACVMMMDHNEENRKMSPWCGSECNVCVANVHACSAESRASASQAWSSAVRVLIVVPRKLAGPERAIG